MLNKSVKNFKQYDSRWGRMTYPKAPWYMSNSGCGATATANIVASNPKYKKRTPKTTRKWLMKNNYVSKGNGTYWAGIAAVLKAYGFKVTNHATMSAFFKEMAKEGRAGVILFRIG